MHHRYLPRQPKEKPPDVHAHHHNGMRVQDAFLLMVLIQTMLEPVRQQELSMILIASRWPRRTWFSTIIAGRLETAYLCAGGDTMVLCLRTDMAPLARASSTQVLHTLKGCMFEAFSLWSTP